MELSIVSLNLTGSCPLGLTPLVPHANAVNPCLFAALIAAPSLILFLFGTIQLAQLLSAPGFGKIRFNKLPKSAVWRLFAILLQTVILFDVARQYFLVNAIACLFIALPLAYLDPFKSPVSRASLLFYFLFTSIFLTLAIIQSLLTSHPIAQGNPRLYLAGLNSIHVFISTAAYYFPVVEVAKYYLELGQVQANILSKLTLVWMNELLEKGYRDQRITEEDIPVPPAALDPKVGYEAFKKVWDSQKKKSLFFAVVRVFGPTVLVAVTFASMDDALSFVSPQLLRLLIKFFNDEDAQPIVGFLLAGGLFLVSLVSVALYNKYFLTIYEALLGTKGAMMTMVYQKALTLSPEAKKERTTGDIVNLMSVDVNRVQDLSNQFQTLIAVPIKLFLCLLSLFHLLGNATFAGIVTMFVMIPINTYLSRQVRSLFKTQMKYKDQRTQATSELLFGMKSIKLYAIEKAMLERLYYVRNELELKNLQKINTFMAAIMFMWYCVPFLVSCSTFSLYAYYSKSPLTPDIAFPALALFDLLSEPIYEIPSLITSIIETSVSFDRIFKFLNADEIDPDLLKHFERVEVLGKTSVMVDNCAFMWESNNETKTEDYDEQTTTASSKIALEIDHFEASKGKLTCIVGRVGSGKSTFLQAILGYLPCIGLKGKEPTVEIHGSIAYCAQVPWIMNATFKENILFGHKFDEEFYQKTLEACQLLPDLEILPDGDSTHVGEKGISLSGGQKARLSLARAVYSRADVFILDDILSAVDAHVGKNIIEQVINGILSSKTIILATNSISVLAEAENIILLENGRIVETGSFRDVVGSGSKISKLISEFGSNTASSGPSSSAQSVVDELSEKPLERRPTLATLRKASMASFKRVAINDQSKRTSQGEEKAAIGKVDFRVYKEYAKACGLPGVFAVIALMMTTQILSISANYWLKNWSENNERTGNNDHVWLYVGVYAALGIGSGFFTLLRSIVMWVYCALKGSAALHDRMALSVVRSPMSFFETTPIGRIMNRFSADVNKVDENLPRSFNMFFSSIMKTIFTLGFIGLSMPSFLLIVVALSIVYIYYQRFYISTSRDLKRIVNMSRSPVFSHLQETLAGFGTILAYQQEPRFTFIHFANVNMTVKSLYMFRSINRWLDVRLQFIGAIIIFATASLAVIKHLSGGMAGLLISYALQATASLGMIVRMTVEVETNIVSAERLIDYCDLPSEAPEETDVKPPKEWPAQGAVTFDHYSTKYRENLDLVLNDISFEVKPQEKVGIVGRTGAGKSTLSLALFRIIEPTSGRILIDGVDTTTLGLHDLRSNLAIIPQDSQAFEGTIRTNLDPLGKHTDEELWRALELSHLKDHIHSMVETSEEASLGLDAKLSEGGSNLSVGQRQLLCLARALLNPSKVLLLDEATASVDVETDRIVQETIRKEFSDRTILTIAHRIDTVMDSDKILCLEYGKVKEFDTPENLLKDKNGLFYNLCVQGGYITADGSSEVSTAD
ncbi:CYFA0S03e01090g1_1 [Cyberlindnera fabianii]|uniref:Bile pigment transporter 1 n=1 Tax=Cyberlindnera fabianii TaxID=36022 RepID=A0A061AWY7_CYBFA|nr:Bile pigment transporter 1 [Cyberlindnera fabianii]CDR39229.1 CYFA0S03e01090g1_1 [Cyberlindnera fabianii]